MPRIRRPFGMEEFGSTAGYDLGNQTQTQYAPPASQYVPPNGNTGVSGLGGGNNPNPYDDPGRLGPPDASAQPAAAKTKLYGTLDQGKLDAARGGSRDSAKYQFLSEAEKSDSYDTGSVLSRLQASDPGRWSGWSASGDKIRYGGDKGALDSVFDGLTEFDVQHDQENQGGWGWQDTSGGPGGLGWGTQGGGPGQGGTFDGSSLKDALAKLFPGGMYNQDLVNRRTESAREDLNRFGKSRTANNRAILASRGLLGDGAEITAQNNVEQDMFDSYGSAVTDIYADETNAASDRMMKALQIAAGLSAEEARQYVDLFRAQNDFTLGQGRLALDNADSANRYNLDLGRFGLDRDKTLWDMENGGIDQFILLLQQLMQGAGQAGRGHV